MLQRNHLAPAVTRALASPEVREWLQPGPDVRPFETAIRRIVPTRDAALIAALFHDRAHAGSVLNWRCGARSAPHWAREILKEKLRQQVAELQSLIERLG